jgi:hypothetical protein
MISVRFMGGEPARYAVIDGMHRVSSLQDLSAEKHPGIDYCRVPSTRFPRVFLEPLLWSVHTNTCTIGDTFNHHTLVDLGDRLHHWDTNLDYACHSPKYSINPYVTTRTHIRTHTHTKHTPPTHTHTHARTRTDMQPHVHTDTLIVGANEARDITVMNSTADRLYFHRATNEVITLSAKTSCL